MAEPVAPNQHEPIDTDAMRALADSFPSRITTHKFCSQAKKSLHAAAEEIDYLRGEFFATRVVGGTADGTKTP